MVGELCGFASEPDGSHFDAASIEIQRIKEDAEYESVHVRFNAAIAKARIPMQIDIGFGDMFVPRPIEVAYTALLEFQPPLLMAYPEKTVVAEKLDSLTALGLLNSRTEDYYDLAQLARLYPFDSDLPGSHSFDLRHRCAANDATRVGSRDSPDSRAGHLRGRHRETGQRRQRETFLPQQLPATGRSSKESQADVRPRPKVTRR
ncbi:MAG: nucleotidyl transferase AbiEii/AbiGii toxin family protein [Bryobacteraceae bacterium]